MLFTHSAIYILARLIPGLLAFIALSLYTHLLSPEEYGIYTLLFTGTLLLHNIVFDWLPAGTLRFWSNPKYSQSEFKSTLFQAYSRIWLVILLIGLIGSYLFWGKDQLSWIIAVFVYLSALAVFTIAQNLLNVSLRPLNYAYLTICYSVMALCFGTLFAYLGYGAVGVICGITLGAMISTLVIAKNTLLPIEVKNHNPILLKRFLKYGMPLAAAAIIEEVTLVSDRFMLAGILGNKEAGLYAVGYDLSGNSIIMIIAAINLATYPNIIKVLDKSGIKAAQEHIEQYAILLLGVSLPAVVGLNLVGPNLIELIISEQYQSSAMLLLPWISWGVFLLGIQICYFNLAFQLAKKTIISVKIAALIAVINISLNYVLIPSMGILGAAIATVSSFVIGCLVSAYWGRRYFALPLPLLDAVKIVIATIFMAICLWWTRGEVGVFWLIGQLLIGVCSVFIVLFSFNVLDIRGLMSDFYNRDKT